MYCPLNTRVTLRPATTADLPWLELWDDDPAVITATSDDSAATVAFGCDWADELAQQNAYSRVTAIVIDPLNSNTRAHAFYQRLAFVPTHRQLFGGTDDCLVHRLTRAAWMARCPQDAPGTE